MPPHPNTATTTTTATPGLKGVTELPPAGTKRAPSFKGQSSQLKAYFTELDELFSGYTLTETQKKRAAVRYVRKEAIRRFWESLKEFDDAQSDWAALKTALYKQYPDSDKGVGYTVRNLRKYASAHKQDATVHTIDDINNYYQTFLPAMKYLTSNKKFSTAEANLVFWRGLPTDVRRVIWARLLGVNSQRSTEEAPSTDDVMEAARFCYSTGTFDSGKVLRGSSGSRKKAPAKRLRKAAQQLLKQDDGSDDDDDSESEDDEDSDDVASDSDDSDSDDEVLALPKKKERLKGRTEIRTKTVTRAIPVAQQERDELEDLAARMNKLAVTDTTYLSCYARMIQISPGMSAVLVPPAVGAPDVSVNAAAAYGPPPEPPSPAYPPPPNGSYAPPLTPYQPAPQAQYYQRPPTPYQQQQQRPPTPYQQQRASPTQFSPPQNNSRPGTPCQSQQYQPYQQSPASYQQSYQPPYQQSPYYPPYGQRSSSPYGGSPPRQTRQNCHFCDDPNHYMNNCLELRDYETAGRVIRRNGMLMWSDAPGMPMRGRVFHPGRGGMKAEVDAHLGPLTRQPPFPPSQQQQQQQQQPNQQPNTTQSAFIVCEPILTAEANAVIEEVVGEEDEMAGIRVAAVEEEEVDEDDEEVLWSAVSELEQIALPDEVSGLAVQTRAQARAGPQNASTLKANSTKEQEQPPLKKARDKVQVALEVQNEPHVSADIPDDFSRRPESKPMQPAYTYESKAARPDTASLLRRRVCETVVQDVTVGDLLGLSAELRKDFTEYTRVVRIPADEARASYAAQGPVAAAAVASPAVDYVTPLREIDVQFANGQVEGALLDQGSEIAVMRQDLWAELGLPLNKEREMRMQCANGSWERIPGCAEGVELYVDGLRTTVNAFVVPDAPYRLLLGRPWQSSVRMSMLEPKKGKVWVRVHDPMGGTEARWVATRPKVHVRDGTARSCAFLTNAGGIVRALANVSGVGVASRIQAGGQLTRHRHAPPSPPKAPVLGYLLSSTFNWNNTAACFAYKKSAATRVRSVPTHTPEEYKVHRRFPEDPLLSLPQLSPQPPPFVPGLRLTQARLDAIRIDDNEFLWPMEKKIAKMVLSNNEAGLAWTEAEQGRFRDDYFTRARIATVPHAAYREGHRPNAPALVPALMDIVRTRLANGTYEFSSNTAYQTGWLAVAKKNGSVRMVHNMKPLNAVTVRDAGVPPFVDHYAEQCAGRSIYTVLDILGGYNHHIVDERDRDYSTFMGPDGKRYRICVLVQGWANSFAVFHEDVAFILQDETGVAPNYSDDICVLGPRTRYELPDGSYEVMPDNPGVRRFVFEHLVDVNRVLHRMKHAGATISVPKMALAQPEVVIVGQKCTYEGRRPDDSMIKKILSWPPCESVSEVRGFLGTVGVTRLWIWKFAELTAPLVELTKKAVPFKWEEEEERAMEETKEAVKTCGAIRPIDYSKPRGVILAVDSSHIAVGYILLQLDESERRRPARFGSIAWNDREARYSQAKLELYGFFRALNAVKLWIVGLPTFTVEVDARYIKGMINNPDVHPNAAMNRWVAAILTFDFDIVHVPAAKHGAADGLSRRRATDDDPIEDDPEEWVEEILGCGIWVARMAEDAVDGRTMAGRAYTLEAREVKGAINDAGLEYRQNNGSTTSSRYNDDDRHAQHRHQSAMSAAKADQGETVDIGEWGGKNSSAKGLTMQEEQGQNGEGISGSDERAGRDASRGKGTKKTVHWEDALEPEANAFSKEGGERGRVGDAKDEIPTRGRVWVREGVEDVDELDRIVSKELPRTEEGDAKDEEMREVKEFLEGLKKPGKLEGDAIRKFAKRASRFFVSGGRLWRRDAQGRHPLVVLERLSRARILRVVHDELDHKRHWQTRRRIADRFWWPTLDADVQWYINTCHTCQTRTTMKLVIPPTITVPSGLFRKIHIDTFYLPKGTRGGWRYIIHGRCSLTGWPEWRGLRKETGRTVGSWFFEDVLCRWGAVEEVVTDNGPPIIAALDWLAKKYKIRHIRISAYNSQANGVIERPHRDVREALVRVCDGNLAKIQERAPYVFWAERTTIKRATGYSPYQMAHGTEPLFPFDITEATWLVPAVAKKLTTAELIAHRARQLEKREADLEEIHDRVVAARYASVRDFERRSEKRIADYDFQPGELVLVLNKRFGKHDSPKWMPRYVGPMVVLARGAGGAYRLAEVDGAVSKNKYAAARLIPYHARSQTRTVRVTEFVEPEDLEEVEEVDVEFVGVEESVARV